MKPPFNRNIAPTKGCRCVVCVMCRQNAELTKNYNRYLAGDLGPVLADELAATRTLVPAEDSE